MKIALIGSSCTGKTTTSKLLSNYYNIPIIPEFALDIAKEMEIDISNFAKYSIETKYEFEYRMLTKRINYIRCLRSNEGITSYISDRSEIDLLTYFMLACDGVDYKVFNKFKNKCITRIKNYDYIFLFDYGRIKFKKEGIRRDRAFYYKEHCMTEGILYENKTSFLHIPKLGKEETAQYIIDYIRIKENGKKKSND